MVRIYIETTQIHILCKPLPSSSIWIKFSVLSFAPVYEYDNSFNVEITSFVLMALFGGNYK